MQKTDGDKTMLSHIDNLFNRITLKYDSFTKAEKKVADYVRENPKEVLYASITDLANRCHVGDTTVFRFCKSLELRGYQDFRMMMAQSLQMDSDIDLSSNLQSEGLLTAQDSVSTVCQRQYELDLAAINETYEALDSSLIERAVTYLLDAKNIYFFGAGGSGLTALCAYNRFLRICQNVHCTFDAHLQSMSASLMTPHDVALVFSYSGSTKDTVSVAQLAKQNGARIVSLTHAQKSPIAQFNDIVLLCGSREGPFQGGSASATITQIFLVDMLYSEFYKRSYDRSKLNKHKTANAVAEKLY